MMKKLVLVGSGGCMRELLWQIEEYNKYNPSWTVIGYVDLAKDLNMESGRFCEYLGDDSYLLNCTEETNVAICIGDPKKRKQLVELYRQNENLHFPPIILSKEGIAPDATFMEGCIVSRNCTISSQVKVGAFAFINIGCTVCHDCKIGDFSTLSPSVTLSGNVDIGKQCYIGVGATSIQGVSVGDETTVGGMAMVISDLPDHVTVVGVPAKVIKNHDVK